MVRSESKARFRMKPPARNLVLELVLELVLVSARLSHLTAPHRTDAEIEAGGRRNRSALGDVRCRWPGGKRDRERRSRPRGGTVILRPASATGVRAIAGAAGTPARSETA